MQNKFWLIKSEPDIYSIDDLAKDKTTWWENIRNYQARNFMTQDMKPGDLVLFYHSNAEPPGIAGVAEISKSAEPDSSQFKRKSDYFEPRATKEKPIWFCVEVRFKEKFAAFLPLELLKINGAQKGSVLADLMLLKKGQRLSVQPVKETEFNAILALAKPPVAQANTNLKALSPK
jgi:predicted RNA-binding protein with PUA-like domain